MGTHIGNDGKVKIGSNFMAEVKEWQLTTGVAIADDTALGDAWDTHLVGTKNWKGSATCQWDESDSNGQELLIEGASVQLLFHPEGSDAGAVTLGGTAPVEEVAYGGALNGVVTRSFTFRGNGALARATVGS
jgi:hypothetical protein